MRYLITGGAGFIGSHLAEKLISVGEEVCVIDDFSTGRMKNIAALTKNKDFNLKRNSIMEEKVLEDCISRCDVIFHLAAAVGVRLIVDRPVETIETNIHGTELVLKHASRHKKKVLLASTSEIYGKNNKVPFREDDDMVLGNTTKSRWSYACSKAIDEFLMLSYYKEKNLQAVILRLFNTAGPRQIGYYGMVIPRFVGQAMEGKPITIYDDGLQSRCFCHVADVVDALIKLAQCEKAVGQVFNVGTDKEITIRQLAERVKKIINDKVEFTFIPYARAYGKGFEDMRRRVPDISKVKKYIDFKVTKDVDDIIRDVRDYFQDAGQEKKPN